MTHTLSRLLVVGDTVCFRDGREFRVDRISERSGNPLPFVQGHPESISGTKTIHAGPTAAYYVNVPFADSWTYGRGVMSYQGLVSGSDSRDDILAIAKTSEDDSANARIIFARDVVPEEFKHIQTQALMYLPQAAIPPAPPPIPPSPTDGTVGIETGSVSLPSFSEAELSVLQEQARQMDASRYSFGNRVYVGSGGFSSASMPPSALRTRTR